LSDYKIEFNKENIKYRPLGKEKIASNKVNNRQVLIKLHGSADVDRIAALGCEILETPEIIRSRGIYIVKIPAGFDYDTKLTELKKQKDFLYVEPDYIFETEATEDQYESQWAWNCIDRDLAWSTYAGSPNNIVAVIDTGVDYNHPRLSGRVLIDKGYDYYNYDTDPLDNYGHGTMVAGLIAAVDRNCKILPIKAAEEGSFNLSAVVAGIYYAVANGANVINMSFGGTSSTSAITEAVYYAYNQGVILVAASGNESADVAYPAHYAPVISIGATDRNDQIAGFSNTGDRLDISAPGVSTISTYLNNNYSSGDGTSFAAPIASGIASLLCGQYPALKPAEIEWLLEKSTPSNTWNPSWGYGIVNANMQAMTLLMPHNSHLIKHIMKKLNYLGMTIILCFI